MGISGSPTWLATASMHDVDGDGLADLVTPTATGVNVYHNNGACPSCTTSFTGPLSAEVAGPMHWTGSDANDTLLFADMDASGVDDIVVVHPTNGGNSGQMAYIPGGVRPGLLQRIQHGESITLLTNVTYESLPALALDTSSNLSDEGPWTRTSPQSISVVTSMEKDDDDGHTYTTNYAYANPTFDGWDRTLVGFQRVRSTQVGSPSDLSTETTFAYPTCGAPPFSVCVPAPDEYYRAYRGLPLLSEVFESTGGVPGTYLSTTHHSYSAETLATGIAGGASAGQNVRRVWDSEVDTYVYDTSNFHGASYQVSIPDINSSDLENVDPGFTVRDTASHTQVTNLVNPVMGYLYEVQDHGLVGTDDTIATKVGFAVDPQQIRTTTGSGVQPASR